MPLTPRVTLDPHNVRLAVEAGPSPETAIAMVTLNPARHMRLSPWVGAVAPGRHADLVLLDDVPGIGIAEVRADGRQVSAGTRCLPAVALIERPEAATRSVRLPRDLSAEDFAVPAPPGRATVTAALLRPSHWKPELLTATLPVEKGLVRRDPGQLVTKFAVIDRHTGGGRVARVFWRGTGPATPDTALACSVAHDAHDVWAVGSSDGAMTGAVNAIRAVQGGWALVVRGRLATTLRLEVGGLMTRRPAEALAAEWAGLLGAAEGVG